jgi:hypothetical protein
MMGWLVLLGEATAAVLPLDHAAAAYQAAADG